MKIFFGENDYREFNRPNKYAFLNWWTDNGIGGARNNKNIQQISDFYFLGKTYVGNAILTLNTLIENGNVYNEADKLIFPIFFNAWHGIELMLKSAGISLNIIFGEDNNKTIYTKINHDIFDMYDELMQYIEEKELAELKDEVCNYLNIFIEELRKVNANFDFARYTFTNGRMENYQFYNAPYGNDKQWQNTSEDDVRVPNTCVDLLQLIKILAGIFGEFGDFVGFLCFMIDDKEHNLTSRMYKDYIAYMESQKVLLYNEEKSFTKLVLREIVYH